MSKAILDSDLREFYTVVNEAAFLNPFSDERRSWEEEFKAFGVKATGDKLREKLLHVLGSALVKTLLEKGYSCSSFSKEDQVLVETACLFEAFLKFRKLFDKHIKKQLEDGAKPTKVTFAQNFIADLHRYGFKREVSIRYFGIFFQIRRAYYFISHFILGESSCMRQLRSHLWMCICTHDSKIYDRYLWNRMEDFSTLLLGDTGTGKGTVAKAIGMSGYIPFDAQKSSFVESFTAAFTSINLSEFSESLIESELFGHRKGAFTGAFDNHSGVLARCSPHGSVLLDEIGDISLSLQVKLLRTLQERQFTIVGGRELKRFSGRIIAATNKNIDELRRQGNLRDDFLYRLSSDVIVIPTLAQRISENPGELGVLIKAIIRKMIGNDVDELNQLVCDGISQHLPKDYLWPGNVRELEQCARSIIIRKSCVGRVLSANGDGFSTPAEQNLSADELLSWYGKILYKKLGTFEAVARQLKVDRRTARKYINGPSSP